MKCRTYPSIAAAASFALLVAVPAAAQEQPNDTKCLLVSNLYSKAATEDKARSTAMQASFFYLGRMSGSAAEVQARLVAEAKSVTAANSGPTMEACAKAMVARAEQLSAAAGPRTAVPQGR